MKEQKPIVFYSESIIAILKKDFLPGAKYMNEPKISRYMRPSSTSRKYFEPKVTKSGAISSH